MKKVKKGKLKVNVREMADELLDLVNEKDEIIGTVWKGEAHKDPTKIHGEIGVAILTPKGEVLFQRRSLNKTNGPGEWKLGVSGHLESGEDPERAAEREVYEELGIKVNPKYFTKHFEKRGNNEARFFWIYYAILDKRKKIALDKNEVMAVKWVKLDKLNEFAKKNNYSTNSWSHKILLQIINILGYKT